MVKEKGHGVNQILQNFRYTAVENVFLNMVISFWLVDTELNFCDKGQEACLSEQN